MTDLTDFLLARIREDEEMARGSAGVEGGGTWTADLGYTSQVRGLHLGYHSEDYSNFRPESAHHVARHDPARVLAECEAKRRIVAIASLDWVPDTTLKHLALPYADHPDYRDEWRPSSG